MTAPDPLGEPFRLGPATQCHHLSDELAENSMVPNAEQGRPIEPTVFRRVIVPKRPRQKTTAASIR